MTKILPIFPDVIVSLIEHQLKRLSNEKERIKCLWNLTEKMQDRYEYEVSEPLEELSKSLDDMDDSDPDDVKCLATIYELLKKKQWVKAVKMFEKADTFVREWMPKKTYVWMYHNYEKFRH